MPGMNAKTIPTPEPIMAMNSAPPGFDAAKDLPKGFIEFLTPLHHQLTPRQRSLNENWDAALQASLRGRLPDYLPPPRRPRKTGALNCLPGAGISATR